MVTGLITLAVGVLRYYTVKEVLETGESDFKSAQGFKRVGASRLLAAAVLAFGVASACVLYQAVSEVSTQGVHFGQRQESATVVEIGHTSTSSPSTEALLAVS